MTYDELARLGSVYVEIETDVKYDDEVVSIDVGDGFDNEYIVYRNNDRGRNRDQWQIELYPKNSSNSYRDRETYYYDYDLRADNFDSRSGVRVRDIGEGSRVVILEKDKDVIKKIMVIDTKDNRGYSYGNWVYGKVDSIVGDYFWLITDKDRYGTKISLGRISPSYLTTGKSYWFDIKDGVLQSVPTTTDPSRQTGNYDRSFKIKAVDFERDKIIIYEDSSFRNGFTIDNYTNFYGSYKYNDFINNSRNYFVNSTAYVKVGYNNHVEEISISR